MIIAYHEGGLWASSADTIVKTMASPLKGILRRIVERSGYTLMNLKVLRDPQRQKPITREDFFNLYFSKADPRTFFFVQVGANDGKTNDPIYPYVTRYGLSGIAIEPQADVYEMLTRTYGSFRGVRCVHAAIGAVTGRMPFYTVKPGFKTEKNFARVTGIASFDEAVFRKTLKNKLPPGAEADAYIQRTLIDVLSFEDLARTYAVTSIDMLQLDCEGYDYEILKTFDFGRFSPSLINLESMHFSQDVRLACERLLAEQGYRTFRTANDICAYRV
ncbi:MAG: FkbM family methyltransferase [Patescibacteria group bacterium]